MLRKAVSGSLRRAVSSSAVLRRHPDTASKARRFACQASAVKTDVVVGVTLDPRAEPLLRRQRRTAVWSTSWTGGLRGFSTASAPEEEEVRRSNFSTCCVAMMCAVVFGGTVYVFMCERVMGTVYAKMGFNRSGCLLP